MISSGVLWWREAWSVRHVGRRLRRVKATVHTPQRLHGPVLIHEPGGDEQALTARTAHASRRGGVSGSGRSPQAKLYLNPNGSGSSLQTMSRYIHFVKNHVHEAVNQVGVSQFAEGDKTGGGTTTRTTTKSVRSKTHKVPRCGSR